MKKGFIKELEKEAIKQEREQYVILDIETNSGMLNRFSQNVFDIRFKEIRETIMKQKNKKE